MGLGLYKTPTRSHKAIYTWYISGIYCQLGDYILPTTLYVWTWNIHWDSDSFGPVSLLMWVRNAKRQPLGRMSKLPKLGPMSREGCAFYKNPCCHETWHSITAPQKWLVLYFLCSDVLFVAAFVHIFIQLLASHIWCYAFINHISVQDACTATRLACEEGLTNHLLEFLVSSGQKHWELYMGYPPWN